MDPEVLIDAVQKRQFLYDKDDQNYCNRKFINAEWTKIAREVGCGEKQVRKRWTKLRDYFRKTHYEMTCPKSGPVGIKKKRWYLYDKMLFVLPYLRDQKSTDADAMLCSSSDEESLDTRDITSSFTNSSFAPMPMGDNIIANEFVDEKQQPRCEIKSGESSAMFLQEQTALADLTRSSFAPIPMGDNIITNEFVGEKQRPRCENKSGECRAMFLQEQTALADLDSEMLKLIKDLKELVQNKNSQALDEDDHFFKNLAPKMKLLGTIDKMECQAEIHMTVLRYIKKRRCSDSNLAPKMPSGTPECPQDA